MFGFKRSPDRVPRIEQDGDKHQRVAEVHIQVEKAGKFAMAGNQSHADQRQNEAGNLQKTHALTKQDKIGDENDHRHRTLLDGDVDGRGKLGGTVENSVEPGETERAQRRQQRQFRPDRRPVAPEMRPGKGSEQRTADDPAKRCQHHRRNVADSQPAGHGIAAPEERGQAEKDIGLAVHGFIVRTATGSA